MSFNAAGLHYQQNFINRPSPQQEHYTNMLGVSNSSSTPPGTGMGFLPQQQQHQQQRQQIMTTTAMMMPTSNDIQLLSTNSNHQIICAHNNNNNSNNNNNNIGIKQSYSVEEFTPQKFYETDYIQSSQQFAAHQPHTTLPTIYPQYATQVAQNFDMNFAPIQTQHLQHQSSLKFQLPPPQPQFFVSTEVASSAHNTKITSAATLEPNALASFATEPMPTIAAADLQSGTSTSSTVTLDGIKICINNHYTNSSPALEMDTSVSSMTAAPSSPIIPAIQHRPIDADNAFVIGQYLENEASSVIISDEPDSTTTAPNSPPNSPEEGVASTTSDHSLDNSPNRALVTGVVELKPAKPSFTREILELDNSNEFDSDSGNCEQELELIIDLDFESEAEMEPEPYSEPVDLDDVETFDKTDTETVLPVAGQRPPSPPKEEKPAYKVNEDVFVERTDGRLYLGTVVYCTPQRYLVSFDDKSEVWCSIYEMRKLGGGADIKDTPRKMCIACKSSESEEPVESCDRCGRGYHRKCTEETEPGSGNWLCKRCHKPMKIGSNVDRNGFDDGPKRRLLSYNDNELHWDRKHRINEEDKYCYCGRSGKIDRNMLQCCRCKNWFHTKCMQNFRFNLMLGDGFFVFCCSICNDGEEFLRRLQMNWIDIVHLALHNLTASKPRKYHHLANAILPLLLAKRAELPIPQEWIEMPVGEFRENVKNTLKRFARIFVSDRDVKRDNQYYGLKTNGPPILPEVNIFKDDVLSEVLTDKFLTDNLGLTLFNERPRKERKSQEIANSKEGDDTLDDIYEFREDRDDDRFTSDDEMPIKKLIEKSIKSKPETGGDSPAVTSIGQIVKATRSEIVETDEKLSKLAETAKAQGTEAVPRVLKGSSRKRKAFAHSTSYKEIVAEAAAKKYECNANRNCDPSSDENSNSSRGKSSLDLIIPPPKNFLGRNNPFLMVTPKKKANAGCSANAVVKSSIVNTTAFDFSEKLAALKSAGLLPNLSTNNLAATAGQPRTLRTIKRRLSAKDITIGPNQEIRKRRKRRLNANIEVISTTMINPIPGGFFPFYAKDFKMRKKIPPSILFSSTPMLIAPPPFSSTSSSSSSSAESSLPANAKAAPSSESTTMLTPQAGPSHGRCLRKRLPKTPPHNSRRSSISNSSTTSNQSQQSSHSNGVPSGSGTLQDLHQTVHEYFGVTNRIDIKGKFSVCAKRRLSNGQLQFLIEWPN